MKQPIEILFETCNEVLGKNNRTLEQFKLHCEKDKVMKEGVEAVCVAIERYSMPFQQQIIYLQSIIHNLEQELAELKKDSVIVE